MHWTDRFDLFLFDFDGLLVDTERVHHRAYQLMCERNGSSLPWSFDEYVDIAHTSAEGLKSRIVPHLGVDVIKWPELYNQKKSIYYDLLKSEPVALMDGVEELLKTIAEAGKKRCVVTNSTREQIEVIRAHHYPLTTIPVWITREQYENPKPSPECYFKAIELLGDSDDAMIGFEDSLRGIKALRPTGAHCVLVCDPTHPQLKNGFGSTVSQFATLSAIPPEFRPRTVL